MPIQNQYTIRVRRWGSTGSYFDISPYIALEGVNWSINPIDASDSGRDQSGKMHRSMIGQWRRLDVTLIPMPSTTMTSILQATSSEWLEVVFQDLQTGASYTGKMYRGATLNATLKVHKEATQYWEGLTLEFIEQ